MKRPEEAEEHYKRALELRKDYAEAHNNYGNLLAEMKRPEDAEKEYKRALELREDDAKAMANLAMLLLAQKERVEEGKEWLKKVWALRDQLPEGEAKGYLAGLVKELGIE